MIVCSVNNISKMYGGNLIFENISLEIHAKERVGIVGRNGSGKTTLFRLLSGEDTPDSGQIHWKKGLGIGYLTQIPTFENQLSTKDVLKKAFEDLLYIENEMKKLELAMASETDTDKLNKLVNDYGKLQEQFTIKGGYEIEANIEKIVNGLNIHSLLLQSFSNLSGGEKTKVFLALALLKKPDLLLLDEPTNHLDLMAVEWLGEFLKGYEGTVIVISHDRYFLDEAVQKIFDLEDGEVTCYHSNFSNFVKEKEERLLREFQAYEEQQKKIKKMKEAIKRLRDWANRANPPNAALHKRARNMERALERMEKLNRPLLNRKQIGLEMEANERSGKDVIVLENVTKGFGEKILFEKIDMHIMFQQRVAIIGENGTGKSTLINLILNHTEPDQGELKLGSNLKIGYLSQNIFSDVEDETVIELFRNEIRVTEGEARHILARFLFYGYMVFQKVSQLSGGEKMRLRLAQLMYQDINLLILDEPTNYLDIESREVLEEALEGYNGTILAVSHDRYFLNKLFDKIYWIESRRVHTFDGNYTWAKEKMSVKLKLKQINQVSHNKKSTNKTDLPNLTEAKDQQIDLKKEIEQLEIKLLQIEKQVSDTVELEDLQRVYEEKLQIEARWEELIELLDE